MAPKPWNDPVWISLSELPDERLVGAVSAHCGEVGSTHAGDGGGVGGGVGGVAVGVGDWGVGGNAGGGVGRGGMGAVAAIFRAHGWGKLICVG